jgi:hypothetical protein
VKFFNPVTSIGDEELADRPRIRPIEIDRIAPFIFVSANQIIVGKSAEIISIRSKVVIDDVEDHTQA